MGLVAAGNFESVWVRKFGQEILSALATARDLTENGAGDKAFTRWFGKPSLADRTHFAKQIAQMRSNLNLRSIVVGFVTLKSRQSHQNARAWNVSAPQLALGKSLAAPGADGLSTIELDLNFNGLPDYLRVLGDGTIDASAGHQGRFQTVIHELTHVLLGTKDLKLANGNIAYGAMNAAALAKEDPKKARENAENWGIFIEACGRNKKS